MTKLHIAASQYWENPTPISKQKKGVPLRYDAQNSHAAYDVHQRVCLCYLWPKKNPNL